MSEEKKIIDSFDGEYRFLSNFYQYPFEYRGLVYPNAEAAFQAQKCSNDEGRIKYTLVKNPVAAKRMGRKEPDLPQDWDQISYGIMKEILTAKFAVDSVKPLKEPREMTMKLWNTGDAELIEGNHWHDNLWGACSCERCRNREHKKRLGKILMEIRDMIDTKMLECASGEMMYFWEKENED